MAPTMEVDKELLTQIGTLIGEAKTTIKSEHTENITALEKRMVELVTVKDTAQRELVTKSLADHDEAMKREIRERLAKPPGLLTGAPGDIALKSFGQLLAETAEYKAAVASGFAGRNSHAAVTIESRVIRPFEQRAVTTVSSGFPLTPVRAGYLPEWQQPLPMRDLLNVVPISGANAVEYVKEDWTYNADYQLAEGDKKAEGNVTYTDATAMVRTIAWFIKVSRQMWADIAWFSSTVEGQLIYGVKLKEDREILLGDGAAGHLHGILPQATALPADIITGADINSFDVLLSAIAYLQSTGFTPTAIVINPLDWAQLSIMKTTYGQYLLGGPPQGGATQSIWTLPVVPNLNMVRGEFLVGDFPRNATLFDREAATVDIAYENEDDFVKNMICLRCEERLALAVFRPQAFVKGSLTPVTVP